MVILGKDFSIQPSHSWYILIIIAPLIDIPTLMSNTRNVNSENACWCNALLLRFVLATRGLSYRTNHTGHLHQCRTCTLHTGIVRALRDKNRSRANCVPIYCDLYQNLQWSLTFDLKVVTHLKSASEASYDVINMATIMRNCSLINAMVCVGMVISIQHKRFF